MSNRIPEDWITDNLFLLVGGNPLPNYVAAKLLLKQGGTLHLFHSGDTEPIAHKIRQVLGVSSRTHQIENPSNADMIEAVVERALKNECQHGTVGLNYTGGTKSMAVHAHASVKKLNERAVLTYLDSRSLMLVRDGRPNGVSVQLEVQPEFGEILTLHDIKAKSNPDDQEKIEPVFPKLNQALAEALSQKEGATAYNKWCSSYLRDGRRNELVEKVTDFPIHPIPFPSDPALRGLAEVMRSAFGTNSETFEPEVIIKSGMGGQSIKKVKHFVQHLDGTWLEHLATEAFQKNATSHHLHRIARSIDTVDSHNSPDFEFDVAALQGYQLYAVSCTRSADKRLCKSKLFEAYVRAVQLGGSEAKTAVVCAYNQPEMLEKETRELWRPEHKSRIRVFGAEHIDQLTEQFDNWLQI